MIYVKKGPGTDTVPTTYEFMEPVRLKIRDQNGNVTTYGYGMGEKIDVLELSLQFLVHCTERLTEIPLADGRFIVEWPEGMKYAYVWPERKTNVRGIEEPHSYV